MPVHPWPHLLRRLKKGMPVLGLDVGTATIGLAVSDPGWKQAISLHTLARTKLSADLRALAEIARARDIAGYVIGLPLHTAGHEGEAARKVRLFASQMEEGAAFFAQEPEISFYDERYSTAAAEQLLTEEAGLAPGKRAAVIDALAAQIILQAALEAYNQGTS